MKVLLEVCAVMLCAVSFSCVYGVKKQASQKKVAKELTFGVKKRSSSCGGSVEKQRAEYLHKQFRKKYKKFRKSIEKLVDEKKTAGKPTEKVLLQAIDNEHAVRQFVFLNQKHFVDGSGCKEHLPIKFLHPELFKNEDSSGDEQD